MGARKTRRKKGEPAARWTEFECPECTANNPWDDGFGHGDELFCAWCGAVLLVKVVPDTDPPRYRLQVE